MSGPRVERITFNGATHTLAPDSTGLVSLAALWQAHGSAASRKPAEWRRNAPAEDFISALAENLKVGVPSLYNVRRGRYFGGSWGHTQIALA